MTATKKFPLVFIIFFVVSSLGYLQAQTFSKDILQPGTTAQIDTARLLSDIPVKSPWGAVLRSAVLPGWGQLYNHKYLKSVVAFSINGLWGWRILYYQHKWRETHKKVFRDRRNDAYWYFGITYLLTLVDAYVDAYLFGFEDAMRLTWKPMPHSSTPVLTIEWRLN